MMQKDGSSTAAAATPVAHARGPRIELPCLKWIRAALIGLSFVLINACTGSGAASTVESQDPIDGNQAQDMQEIAPGDEILVVGATGSVGRLVVADALDAGYRVRALVRDRARAERLLPSQATLVVGDLTDPASLPALVGGIDGIVFTHGASGETAAREVNYGGVRNILFALDERPVRVAMMSAVGVTRPIDPDRRSSEPRGWKRRGERLLRASGMPYTIVRPGWFDYNAEDQQRMVFRQGDTEQTGTPQDGVIARRQIANVLVASLSSATANRKTLELVAERGSEQSDLDPLFAALEADADGALDGPRDQPNLPLSEEPEVFREDLRQIKR
ncbi:MAG: SDR family oxidoreductase [Xanthomonadales bacterium]|nr:SDR family oxidoreductase [Xanthomonadales bacterium]